MSPESIVIIGASLVGATAAGQLREEGFEGRIALVGEEPDPPYERPPLSKAYLRGEEAPGEFVVHASDFYAQQDIDLRLSTRATAIDPAAREVVLDGDERLTYDRLLLATGSTPRLLDIPGHDLEGIHYLRRLADSTAIAEAATHASRAVVVGAGWIGSEVAASLRQLGLAVSMVAPDATPLERVLGDEVGGIFRDLHAEHGVDLRLGQHVAGFEGDDRVEAVRLADGTRLEADLVVVGIGARPRVELAAAAGLDVGDGVLVDERLESSVPGIHAAGDIAEAWHPTLETRLRVEHWDTARRQGRHAARSMLGMIEPYLRLPYFFSDQYDLSMEYRGFAPTWERVVIRGDLERRELIAFWLHEGRVVAAMNANVSKVAKPINALLASRAEVAVERLADASVPLEDLVSQEV